jgi:hypothetical protein
MEHLMTPRVECFFFEDFRGSPTVLLCADQRAFAKLANDLRRLSDGRGLDFACLDYVALHASLSLTAQCVPSTGATGLKCVRDEPRSFRWNLEPEMVLEIAEKLEELARTPKPGHQYLNVLAAEDCVLVASMNEYDVAELRKTLRG